MDCTVEVTFKLPAAEVDLDVDLWTGVCLDLLSQMAGTPVTGVMYKMHDKWKMLQVDSGYAKPSDNDWRISDIYHLFPPQGCIFFPKIEFL